MRSCDKHIVKTLELTKQMMNLADEGDADREDTGCGILYGVLRDSAYKLKKLAQEEKKAHIKKGLWKESEQVANEFLVLKDNNNIGKERRK